jgi:2-polyprenyl-3-methyl-5-hydroxy-6-metoxy-1,4-benzoquinol methylase
MSYKNKFDINYWLRKIYTTKIFQLLPISNTLIKKKIFTTIYKSKHWVQNSSLLPKEFISASGHGSNINSKQHNGLTFNFLELIKNYKINSILDMPCGDFLWIKNIIQNNKVDYLGVDIVDELIDNKKKLYQNENINFEISDIVDFKTSKKFDLVLIRDLFIHIKNIDITKILYNLKLMNIKYVALNSYMNEKNIDVIIGQHRKINLLIEPFNLKEPIYKFRDYEDDKFFYLYDLKTLS